MDYGTWSVLTSLQQAQDRVDNTVILTEEEYIIQQLEMERDMIDEWMDMYLP